MVEVRENICQAITTSAVFNSGSDTAGRGGRFLTWRFYKVDKPEVERTGPGRRMRDEECLAHEERLDSVDNEVHKQSGWLKASAILLTVAILITGWLSSSILTKLSGIEGMLSDTKVNMMQHTEQIKNLDMRVRDIEDRNKYIDQQSGVLGGNRLKAIQ
jgi:hypothetical protein